ncbi:MAG TPA: MBL fold metallo-hydrolase [Mycobacteriales bacterium]|nr:MBL fold metallo-hydrolase [Mycobacteriales bacterium]
MRLTIVGCSGTYPGPGSPCSSYLVEEDGFRLVLDMGNGSLGPLDEACGLLEPDAVVISHLHGDHYFDLLTYTYVRHYHPAGSAPVLPVYGPSGLPGVIEDPEDPVEGVYDVRPIDSERTIDVGPFEITLRRMNHSVETYGMRISAGGRTIAYSADTAPCDALTDLARDADLMLCEASFLDGEHNPPGLHMTGGDAGAHATRAGAGRLVLTHLVPWGDVDRTLAGATASYSGDIAIAHSLDRFEI